MLPIPLLNLANFHLDSKDGIKELAVLSYPIDKSDGTSSTVSYVNSLAILYADGLLVLTGANMYGECGTGDRNECVYPNESIRSIKHVWRADRAFVVETFDNEIKYIGCTAGLIGSTAAGGNDVCVTQWTVLPSQITTTLGLDKHPERLLEVCGGMNNTCWVIGAPEGEGIWDIYGSGNNTYGSLHVDKNQHANPVKIAETSQNPVTGQWKNPAVNLEVHDNSVIYGGPDGYWVAGYDFLRNNNELKLVYPPEHGTWVDLTGNSETYKWFMCGPNGAVVATERIHTNGLPAYVFRGQDSWGDKTWRELNITYSREVIIARGHATNGIFFDNGSKQYKGFSRNLCNDIGWSSTDAPRAKFQHKRVIATAAYVEQRTPVSWAENVYFQGIRREGYLGTLTVVNGKLWWSGIPRGNFPGCNNLFSGQLNSQGFTQVDPNWIKNVPVSDFEVEEVIRVNGWGSEHPVSTIYIGDTVQLRIKALPRGATWFVDKVEVVNAYGNVVNDPLHTTATINHNVFGVWDSIVTEKNNNINRLGTYSVKITYHDKNGTHTHLTRNINWNTIVPVIPSNSTWYTQGLNRSLSLGSTTYLGLNSAQPVTENADAFNIRLHRRDAGSVTYDVTQELYDQRREMYNSLVVNQALWEYNPNGAGGKMYQANEQNGTSLNVHKHANPWPTPEKPAAGARTLKVVSYDAGFFGLRWESTIEYYDGTHQNIGLTLGGDSANTSRKIVRTPRGVDISVDLVKNSYGDIQAQVTPAEATTNISFSFAAFKEDPRVVGAHDADWYYTVTPTTGTTNFMLGMKRDMQNKLGVTNLCYVCIKNTRVKDTDPEAKWFTVDPNTTRSDKFVNEYILCAGGTNLNLFYSENADKYCSYDYLRDYCCNQWFNNGQGYVPHQCQTLPVIFTDNQTFLLKQANEVQVDKNGYDGTKWFFNCYAQYYWGPSELLSDASCNLMDKEIGSWTHMNQTCNFTPQNATPAGSPVLDAYIRIEKVHDPRGDQPAAAMAVPMTSGFQQVKLVVSCDQIGKNVPTGNVEGIAPYVIDCYYNINSLGYKEAQKITSTDTSKCRRILLGAGWWLYEFDFSTVADWATDSGNTLSGIRFNFGQTMLPEAINGDYGDPVVHVKQVMLEKTDQSEVYGKQLQLIKNWYEAETARIPKTRGVVLDAGTEDMLVNAVWPNLDGTFLENAARSINWFNFHRAMWSVNIFLWKLFHDQTKGFGSGLRVAPICWTSLMRCYDNQWEIGGREWQEMRMRIYSQFAVKPVNYYNSGTSRILFQEGSEAYKVEGYSGSMIEWGTKLLARETLAKEICQAMGGDLIQKDVPRWMKLPCWSVDGAQYSNVEGGGDLFLYFEDMTQYDTWTPGDYSVQLWGEDGSLKMDTTLASNTNFLTIPKARLEEYFGTSRPDPVTISMAVHDATSGALGPRVTRSCSGIDYSRPIEYMDARRGCTLSPDPEKAWWGFNGLSWIIDEYILIYPGKALDTAVIYVLSTDNALATFVVRKDLAYRYPTPEDGTIPNAVAGEDAWCVPVEIYWAGTEDRKEDAGVLVKARATVYDENGKHNAQIEGPYVKGYLELSPRVVEKTGDVSIFSFYDSDSWALMDESHTWGKGASVDYEVLLKSYSGSTAADIRQEHGTYPYDESETEAGFYVTDHHIAGGRESISWTVTSDNTNAFTPSILSSKDRKFTVSSVANGSATITLSLTITYGGDHTISKSYNWKIGA